MKAVDKLVEISIINHNALVTEFGRNEYWENKLVNALDRLGYENIEIDEDEYMTLDGVRMS
jgi:hypothetical protein